jgi:hypothetical protein
MFRIRIQIVVLCDGLPVDRREGLQGYKPLTVQKYCYYVNELYSSYGPSVCGVNLKLDIDG